MPLAPLHSMNGDVRKSSRQEPGDDRDWPPPSFPAAVCCGDKRGGNEAGVKSKKATVNCFAGVVSAA